MNKKQKQNLKDAFDSILRADYINLDNLNELGDLEKYFVDFFGVLPNLMKKQDSFISGRRGTGKTTNLLRGYYECIKSISPKIQSKIDSDSNKKILPIYVDLSTCNDLFDSNDDLSLLEVHFIRQIIESLKNQLDLMFDDNFLVIFKKENPALEDLEFIEKILVEGITISTAKKFDVTTRNKNSKAAEISAELSAAEPKLKGKLGESSDFEQSSTIKKIKGLNVQEFLNKINNIKKKAKIDYIYVFIDEYSDLNPNAQEKFSGLLKSFLGSKIGMYFKIGVITDRYDFGEKIIIGRDIYSIPLDFNEYAGLCGGAIAAISKTQDFVDNLIVKRIENFCPDLNKSEIFKSDYSEILYRITRETLGVSRTIGIILQNAFSQANSSSDGKIGLAEINYGISSARKMYQKQFTGSVKKKLVPGFHMDMWNAILKKSIEEKNKFPDRPSSHFMLDPIRKEYLNVLCENFMVHFISDNVVSKHGGNYNLYSLDYDVCIDYGIKYADKKDEYTPIRFIYDSVISNFDGYFLKSKQKSYNCPECGLIYTEEEVQQAKVKRCFEDDTKLQEIIHQQVPITNGNFAEVEIKILGLISQLQKEEAMTAREVADSVGCTVQKISAWAGKVLEKSGDIRISREEKPYKYYTSDEDIV